MTKEDLDHLYETIYDHGGGKYRGEASLAQREKAFQIIDALKAHLEAQPEPVAIPDCGDAGHDEGRCGNASCVPGKWGKLLREARDHAYDEEGYTLHPDLAEAVQEVDAMLAAAPMQPAPHPLKPGPGGSPTFIEHGITKEST